MTGAGKEVTYFGKVIGKGHLLVSLLRKIDLYEIKQGATPSVFSTIVIDNKKINNKFMS